MNSVIFEQNELPNEVASGKLTNANTLEKWRAEDKRDKLSPDDGVSLNTLNDRKQENKEKDRSKFFCELKSKKNI